MSSWLGRSGLTTRSTLIIGSLWVFGSSQGLCLQPPPPTLLLPPIELKRNPKPPGTSFPSSLETQVQGRFQTGPRGDTYQGLHWTDRFASLSVSGFKNSTLSIPVLDLGLLDTQFVSQVTESALGSELRLSFLPLSTQTILQKHTLKLGSDLSAYQYHQADLRLSPWIWRLQLSHLGSLEQRSFFRNHGTPFFPEDDGVQPLPSLGRFRIQVALGGRHQQGENDLRIHSLYSFLRENHLGPAVSASNAWLTRQIWVSDAQGELGSCPLADHRCWVQVSSLVYQSQLDNQRRSLTFHWGSQELNFTSLKTQTRLKFQLDPILEVHPKIGLQASFGTLKTQDPEGHTDFSDWQAMPGLDFVGPWLPWVLRLESQSSVVQARAKQQIHTRLYWESRAEIAFLGFHPLEMELAGVFHERPPTFFETYGGFGQTVGNPDLKPETYAGGLLSLHIHPQTVFPKIEAKIQNSLITYWNLIHFLPTSTQRFVAMNIGQAQALGTSVSSDTRWTSWFSSRVSVKGLFVTETVGGRSRPIPGVAQWQIQVAPVFYLSAWVTLQYLIHFRSPLFFDGPNLHPFPAAWDHSLSLAWQIPATPFRLSCSVENLWDHLSQPVPWPGSPHHDAVLPILHRWGLPQLGRLAWIQLDIHLERP